MHEKYENLKDKMTGHGSNDTIQFEGHEKFETKKVIPRLAFQLSDVPIEEFYSH